MYIIGLWKLFCLFCTFNRTNSALVIVRALVIVLPCYGALEIVGIIIIIIIIIINSDVG